MLFVRLVQLSIGCVVIGSMAVTLTMSFAALIYSGALAPHLGAGVAFSLLGGAAMAAVGAFTHSVPGAISNPQDVTAVLLGAAALGIAMAGIVTGEALFPTVLALLSAASVVAGVTVFLAGVLRLGSLVRYAPYPVIAGFLAATGYLLVMGALGIVSREGVTVFNIAAVLGDLPLAHWLPWMAAGLGLAILTRKIPGDFTLPAALCLAAVAFFAILAALGLPLEAALAQGLLLGPFHEAEIGGVFSSAFVARVDWPTVIAAAPTLAAVAGLTLLGSMLNTTGFAITMGQTQDTERDMRATGLSNMAAAAVGGMPGYLILSESILARRMGITGYLPGLVAAVACGGAVFVGTEYLGYAPAGLMAMVVAYLGFDLLGTWLLSSRRRLPAYEYAIVVLIVLVAACFGFLEALALGTLATAAIFVISYAKTDVLRSRTTAASRRSRVERSDEAMEHLSRVGHACVVLELSGFLFFGTADRVARLAASELDGGGMRFLVLDFARVSGLDASAAISLADVASAAHAAGVKVTFCAMAPEVKRQFLMAGGSPDALRFADTTDAALEWAEERLLDEAGGGDQANDPHLLELVERLESEFADRPDIIRRVDVPAGEDLLTRGSRSSELYVLVRGKLRAEIETSDAARLRVAEFREGALVGELAFYANVPRTAWVVADRPSKVVRIDLGRVDDSASPNLLAFHEAAARSMARRVMRMTEYARDLSA